jgi:CubicO group peptidase (beta-lactamase class C family)
MDKQFTAVAIGQLVEQGRLRLDARLIDVLPDYPNRAAAETITIRHLLSHRAGLGMLFERPGWDWKRRYERVTDLLPLFATAPPAFEPGSRFAYSNEGFVVLGAVVERLSGRSWYDYAAAHIFAPAGMRQTEYLTDDPAVPNRAVGYQFRRTDPLSVGGRVPNWGTLARRGNSCGGSFSTAGDMIRFLGALRGGKLLRPETLAALVDHGEDRADYYASASSGTTPGPGARSSGTTAAARQRRQLGREDGLGDRVHVRRARQLRRAVRADARARHRPDARRPVTAPRPSSRARTQRMTPRTSPIAPRSRSPVARSAHDPRRARGGCRAARGVALGCCAGAAAPLPARVARRDSVCTTCGRRPSATPGGGGCASPRRTRRPTRRWRWSRGATSPTG